jgi:hypothetical protein
VESRLCLSLVNYSRSVGIVIPSTHPSECKACNDRVQVPKSRKRIREAGSFRLSGAVYENEMNPQTWDKSECSTCYSSVADDFSFPG